MFKKLSSINLVWLISLLMVNPVMAQTPAEILTSIKQAATSTPGFQGFSVARGESFFKSTHGNDWLALVIPTTLPKMVNMPKQAS